MVSVLANPPPGALPLGLASFLQRLGSFLKFLSWKKCCSPAVNTKSALAVHTLEDAILKLRHSTLPVINLNCGRIRRRGLRPAAGLFNLPA
jgi:hypothetical protein